MDNLLKIIERAGNDLLQADEYLARFGHRSQSDASEIFIGLQEIIARRAR